MLISGPVRRMALLAGLLLAVAAATAASQLLQREPKPWQVAAVTMKGNTPGAMRLAIEGEALPAGLQALLIPDTALVGSDRRATSVLPLATYQFAADGQLAVVSTRDHRLLTLDIMAGKPPRVLGGVKLPSPFPDGKKLSGATKLAMIDGKAVVARSPAGVALVELSNPATPRQIAFLPLKERLLDMQVRGNTAYLASDTAGLLAVTPQGEQLASRKIPHSRPAARVAIEGHRLVTAAFTGELAFYDFARQGEAHLVGTQQLSGDIRDLVFADGTLMVATAAGELLAYSLDAWPRPKLIARLELPAKSVTSVEWLGASRQICCTLVGRGVAVIAVDGADALRLQGIVPREMTPVSINPVEDRLFLAGASGLEVLKLSTLGDALSPPMSNARSLSAMDGRVHVQRQGGVTLAHNSDGLQILSAAAVHPGERGFLALPDRNGVRLHAVREGIPARDVIARIPVDDAAAEARYGPLVNVVSKAFWQAGQVYALSPSKLSVFGVDEVGKVTSREELAFPERLVEMVWLPGGFIVLAAEGAGLKVVDVRQSGNFRVIGGYPFPKHQRFVGAIKGLLVEGSRLYVARARLGVEIYDLTSPHVPRLLQRIDTPGAAQELTLADNLLLVSDREGGLFVVDLRGEAAVAVGSYHLPALSSRVACDGTALYTVDASGNLQQFPTPQRLTASRSDSPRQAMLEIPPGTPPGRYRLTFYDDERSVTYPVTL